MTPSMDYLYRISVKGCGEAVANPSLWEAGLNPEQVTDQSQG